ncbi:MAG: hypothetical protein WDO56_20000 [Gammaproteobacteria bacterium]
MTPLPGECPNGAVIMHLDITAERETQESLRISEARFRQMAENILDVFFLRSFDSSRVLLRESGVSNNLGPHVREPLREPGVLGRIDTP